MNNLSKLFVCVGSPTPADVIRLGEHLQSVGQRRRLLRQVGQVVSHIRVYDRLLGPGGPRSPRHRYACQTKLVLATGGVKLS